MPLIVSDGTVTATSVNLGEAIGTAAVDDASPSVLNLRVLRLPANTTSAVTLLALDDGIPGQFVTLVWTTMTNPAVIGSGGASTFTLSSAFTPTLNGTLTVLSIDGTNWLEVARAA